MDKANKTTRIIMNQYNEFLKTKQYKINPIGKDISEKDINKKLFPFQKDILKWAVKNGECDNETWIKWAHGIWTDINETNTLQYYIARDKDDEKHVCPLQLETIERCIKLYSNPKETILTPFMGIGSEAFMALKLKRKAIGIELKESYFKIAIQNLDKQELDNRQDNLL